MGRKKQRNRRSREAARADPSFLIGKQEPLPGRNLSTRSKFRPFLALGFAVILFAGLSTYAWLSTVPHQQSPSRAVAQPVLAHEQPPFDGSYIPDPLTYDELLKLSPGLLDHVNVGLMDLLCSQGLPGSENLNINECLKAISSCAEDIAHAEEANASQFDFHPGLYRHSRAYYKAVVMVSEMNALGIHVDEQRSNDEPNASFFAKSNPVFIHGLLGDRHAGTCSSIPILIVAIGQRLGYPIKLVCNSNHFFARWDDGKDRFNIDATVLLISA